MTSKKEKTHIKDLVPDKSNRRKHTPRNIGMISDSLNAVGAWRSIAIDENDVVHAGNGVIEAAADAGITKLRIIEAKGDEIIAVRRRGLTDDQKRLAAMYDNRTSELAEWDIEQLKADAVDGLDLKPFFFESELGSLLDQAEGADLNDFFQSDTGSKSTDDGKTLTLTFRPDEYIAVIEALRNREGTNEQVLMELLGVNISVK